MPAYSNIPPMLASYMAGQDQTQDILKKQLDQRHMEELISELQQKQQFSAQDQPGKLQNQSLTNQGLTLDNIGKGIGNESSNLKLDTERATQESAIDSANAANRAKLYETIGSHFGTLADSIENNPNAPPHASFQQAMIDAQFPQKAIQGFANRYKNVPPDQLAKKLREDGDRFLRENKEYAKDFDRTSLETSSHIVANAANNASQERRTAIMAGARIATHDPKAQVTLETQLLKAPNARARYSLLIDGAKAAMQSGDADYAAHLMERAEQQHNQALAETAGAVGAAGGPDVGGIAGIPTVPPKDIRPPGAPAPAASGQPKVNSLADLQKLYPGKDIKTLQQAYKQRYGVDLK